MGDPDAREFADVPGELPIPGSGERLADCGDELPPAFCEDCGHPMRAGRTCRRSRCPRCWKAWAFYRAQTAAAKIEGLRRKRNARTDRDIYNHHLTVSFANLSMRFDSADPIGRMFEVVKVLVGRLGLDAGYLAYHPWRIAKEYRGNVLGHNSGEGDMTWKDILQKVHSDAWTWDAVRDEFLVFAPHVHVIGPSNFVDGGARTETIEEKTGVVVERITKGKDSSVSLYDVEDLAAATAYAFSHAGLDQRETDDAWQSAIRMFGETANFTPTEKVEADVDEALREVSPTVLGLTLPDRGCSTERIDEDAREADLDPDKLAVAAADAEDGDPPAARAVGSSGGAGSGSGSGSASTDLPGRAGRLELDAGGSDDSASEWDAVQYGVTDDAGEAWEATAGHVPAFIDEPPDEFLSRCGGKLIPMWKADEYLGDLDWRASIDDDVLADLEAAYREWDDLGPPDAQTIPALEDGPPHD